MSFRIKKEDGCKPDKGEAIQQKPASREILESDTGWNRSVLLSREAL